LLIVGGAGLWLLRDRIPWPPPRMSFAHGRSSGWIPLPGDGLIEMPAQANGHSFRLVVDSGAQFSAIDAGLARSLGLSHAVALPMVAYGVSGKPTLTHTVRLDLRLPGLAISGARAAVLDIAAISQVTGRDFSMLLGRDVLGRLVLEADLPRDRAAFHAPDAYRPPAGATVAPLEMERGAPTLTVIVDGAPLKVMVDTGATGALALSEEAAERAGLLGDGRRVRRAHSVSLGGLSLDRIVVAEAIQAAGMTVRRAPVQIYSPGAPGPLPAGLLGVGFLRGFRMALDLPGRRLVLTRPGPLIVPPP
jgi:predicted aspartyl protease